MSEDFFYTDLPKKLDSLEMPLFGSEGESSLKVVKDAFWEWYNRGRSIEESGYRSPTSIRGVDGVESLLRGVLSFFGDSYAPTSSGYRITTTMQAQRFIEQGLDPNFITDCKLPFAVGASILEENHFDMKIYFAENGAHPILIVDFDGSGERFFNMMPPAVGGLFSYSRNLEDFNFTERERLARERRITGDFQLLVCDDLHQALRIADILQILSIIAYGKNQPYGDIGLGTGKIERLDNAQKVDLANDLYSQLKLEFDVDDEKSLPQIEYFRKKIRY